MRLLRNLKGNRYYRIEELTVAEEFDYIIVGGGSAGCVLANRLSQDASISVLLLEAGGNGRSLFVDMPTAFALSNVVSAEDYAASTTDYTPELSQNQGDFTGKLNRFTATAQEDLGGFQNEIRTLLLDKVPQIQATTGANYEQALYTAYTQDPEVQQLLGQYGVNPLFADGTGQYLYDPFSFGELRTYEINESDFATGVRTLAEIGKAVMAAQVMGGLTSAALSATGLPTGAEAGTGAGAGAGEGSGVGSGAGAGAGTGAGTRRRFMNTGREQEQEETKTMGTQT